MENKNIYSKLMEVRVKFHKLDLKKSGLNKFAGFKYYELGDFLIQGTQLLQEANLCPIIAFTNEVATLTLVNGDNPTETIVFTSPMRDLTLKGTNEIQNLGGVQTYLTRYLYTQLLNIVEADVFDSTSGREDKKEDKELSEAQIKRLYAIAKSNEISSEELMKGIMKYFNKTDVKKLTKKEYDELCTKIDKKATA